MADYDYRKPLIIKQTFHQLTKKTGLGFAIAHNRYSNICKPVYDSIITLQLKQF